MSNNSILLPPKEECYCPVYFENFIRLTIEGEPVGKGRPRVTTRGSFAHAYTPKKTKNYERQVMNAFLDKYNYSDQLSGPIEASIMSYFPIPKSTNKKNKALMISNKIFHTKKPDIDNIAKSVLDSLNGLAYADDSQIVKLSGEKLYSDQPRVELYLKEIHNGDDDN